MDRGSFDDFVATRCTRLLRTAYLLTHDRAGSETLPQPAGRGQWLTVRLGEGSPGSTGTAYIATYSLEK